VEPAGRLRTICHVQPGQWLVEGISFYAGAALRWLRDEGVRAAAGRPAGYTWLEHLAAAVPPGARGLTARLAPADAWTWAHWQPPFPSRPTAEAGEQARAIQEAAAYSTRLTAGLISEMLGLGAWPEVILTGGAARSTLWPQILADVLGGPVSVPNGGLRRRPPGGLQTEFREQSEIFHLCEDRVVRHQRDAQPDRRCGDPAVGLVILPA
jgi:autoinducer 2 (AI-2) kinase